MPSKKPVMPKPKAKRKKRKEVYTHTTENVIARKTGGAPRGHLPVAAAMPSKARLFMKKPASRPRTDDGRFE